MRDRMIDSPFRIACRGCSSDQMDFLETLEPAVKAGWRDIVTSESPDYPLPSRWWTHIGTCPRCQELEAATTEQSFKLFGLTIRLRTAS